MQPLTIGFNDYVITTDKSQMNVHDIHFWLTTEAYWCKGIPFDTFRTAFENSFCIGAITDGRQIAFARLITDYATFAYLADVFVIESYRGKGISNKMMEILMAQDWVKSLRCIRLATMGTHWLYRKFEFTDCAHPERIMEIVRPDIYKMQIGQP
jgi:GNAT superfamily N-acetyltransferase